MGVVISKKGQYHLHTEWSFCRSIFLLQAKWMYNKTDPTYAKYCLFRQSSPITGLYRPLQFQEVEASRSLDNRHMKVVRLSAYAPAAFTHQEIFLVLTSVRG
jgi:hypothetical protein